MESLFGWFGALMEWFGNLIPRIQIVYAFRWYVAWTRMQGARLRTKAFVYWPFWTSVWSVSRLLIVESLSSQMLTTLDRRAVLVDAVIAYRVTDPLANLTICHDTTEAIDETAGAAIREVICTQEIESLLRRVKNDLDDMLTEEAQDLLAPFGIQIEYIHLTSLAETRVLSLVGDVMQGLSNTQEN